MPAVASHVRRRSEQRHMRLVALGFKSYVDYIRSPTWKQVKARYRASDLPQDCMCGETKGLHLHHLTYERIGEEELSDLAPLCRRCHEMIHDLERRGVVGLDLTGLVSEQRAARYRPAEEVRAERQRAEYRVSHDDEEHRHRIRSVMNRLREAARMARDQGIDISPELARISEQIAAIERRLD